MTGLEQDRMDDLEARHVLDVAILSQYRLDHQMRNEGEECLCSLCRAAKCQIEGQCPVESE